MTARILSVAESDSSGARGIQADIKTVLALGGYATTAVSAVIAQSIRWAEEVQLFDPQFVAKQMRLVIDDVGVDAIKIGVLATEGIVDAVSDVLDECQDLNVPVVVDPAIVGRHGDVFMDDGAVAAMKRRLFIRTTVLTPNLQEAEKISGVPIKDIDDMRYVADMLRTVGVDTIVLKGGEAVNGKLVYFVSSDEGERIYEHDIIQSVNTVGAGCTLAAAIATSMGQGKDVFQSIERALEFMNGAIKHAPNFGGEEGPINHAFGVEKHGAFFESQNIIVCKQDDKDTLLRS